jgi:hypothetical protein
MNLRVKMYRTTILPLDLHACETWTLNLRREYKMWVSESNMLRRIIIPKTEEVTGE